MQSNGAPACFSAPGHRLGECIVDFECGGAVAELRQGKTMSYREQIAGKGEKLARSHVAHYQSSTARQLTKRKFVNAARGVHDPAERFEMANERMNDCTGAAAWNGPADGMSGRGQHQRNPGAEGLVKAQK